MSLETLSPQQDIPTKVNDTDLPYSPAEMIQGEDIGKLSETPVSLDYSLPLDPEPMSQPIIEATAHEASILVTEDDPNTERRQELGSLVGSILGKHQRFGDQDDLVLDAGKDERETESGDAPIDARMSDETPSQEGHIGASGEHDPKEAVDRLRDQGFVKDADHIRDQITEERDNTIQYVPIKDALWGSDPSEDAPIEELTERESIEGLVGFLEEFIQAAEAAGESGGDVIKAKDMLENITYVGEKEYAEAVQVFAEYWKSYLDEDPKRQLCVLTDIDRFSNSSRVKSDKYFFNRILEQFTDDELDMYGDRIVTEPGDITAELEDLKIVLLDDWTISGSQLRNVYRAISGSSKYSRYVKQLEVNLIAASPDRVENGLEVFELWRDEDESTSPDNIPVKAYIKAHKAKTAKRSDSIITGSHSSVDFDFEGTIEPMIREHIFNTGTKAVMPPASNIVRPYRYSQLAEIDRFKRRQNDRRNRE